MKTIASPTDGEREDGEIVDDFEDISDYSIPSSGKSDCSQDILRAISLSSISDSGGEREPSQKHYLPTRKRHRCKSDTQRGKKKRKHGDMLCGYNSRKSKRLLSTSSSGSDADGEKLDKRTLRQLKEAVRINTSTELHHNSLRTRLKAMIDLDSQEDEDVEALRTLALLTKNEGSPKPPDKLEPDDTLNDKELAELRSEALKSAVIKKHMERKKLKEMDKQENNNEVQKEVGSNDKENENKEQNDAIEEDVDVMRAMLLASISKRITSTPAKNPVCKPTVTSTPNVPPIKNRTALQNKQTNSKPIKLPSVKPLIIRLNSDSESDFDKSSTNNPEVNPIDETVTKLLKMHREKFEAKEKQSIQNGNTDNNKDSLLDKSVVKLLSKSQQREYQLLKQKLLLANRRRVRRISARVKSSKKEPGDEKNVPEASNLKKTLQELQFQKDGRLQMKGKYKELAPLIQKVNIASRRRKQCEENMKSLLAKLREARVEHAESHENFNSLVQKLKQAKENIDLRLSKMVKANTNTGTKPQPLVTTLKKINSNPVKPKVPILPKKTTEVKKPQKTTELKEPIKPPEKPAAPVVQNNVITTKVQNEQTTVLSDSIGTPSVLQNNVNSEETESEGLIAKIQTSVDVQKEEASAKVQNEISTQEIESTDMDTVITSKPLQIESTEMDTVITSEPLQIAVDEPAEESCSEILSNVEIKYSEYVSPLDRRNQIASNPLQMLCPYELFGNCRDQDCVFKHCP